MKKRIAYITDKGEFRTKNQDAYYSFLENVGTRSLAVIAVMDGVGAFRNSEFASEYVKSALKKFIAEEKERIVAVEAAEVRLLVLNMLQEAHYNLLAKSEKLETKWGTTASIFLAIDNAYYVFHVGDTKILIYAGDEIKQLTKNQTLAERKRSQGRTDISAKDESTLLQCIGYNSIAVDVTGGILPENCYVLACSDGFYNKLENLEIESILTTKLSLKKKLTNLVCSARAQGETDNITGVLFYNG